ncbi:hypothetical protein TRFO_10193 [Tritrichomonas foetus]|uniref:Uncharacterized protein n=1 Tax=Tritrichomonas foetus TaxID=1144522 RepID=A0A1J4JFL5_9EUKA|nr:hypothetical protein TRFO_10193 [Tritrichomonas foetus]|eukprot:OHS96020.1 hypothetical protein TRFO_10193 [Tritrichomonas foetus]
MEGVEWVKSQFSVIIPTNRTLPEPLSLDEIWRNIFPPLLILKNIESEKKKYYQALHRSILEMFPTKKLNSSAKNFKELMNNVFIVRDDFRPKDPDLIIKFLDSLRPTHNPRLTSDFTFIMWDFPSHLSNTTMRINKSCRRHRHRKSKRRSHEMNSTMNNNQEHIKSHKINSEVKKDQNESTKVANLSDHLEKSSQERKSLLVISLSLKGGIRPIIRENTVSTIKNHTNSKEDAILSVTQDNSIACDKTLLNNPVNTQTSNQQKDNNSQQHPNENNQVDNQLNNQSNTSKTKEINPFTFFTETVDYNLFLNILYKLNLTNHEIWKSIMQTNGNVDRFLDVYLPFLSSKWNFHLESESFFILYEIITDLIIQYYSIISRLNTALDAIRNISIHIMGNKHSISLKLHVFRNYGRFLNFLKNNVSAAYFSSVFDAFVTECQKNRPLRLLTLKFIYNTFKPHGISYLIKHFRNLLASTRHHIDHNLFFYIFQVFIEQTQMHQSDQFGDKLKKDIKHHNNNKGHLNQKEPLINFIKLCLSTAVKDKILTQTICIIVSVLLEKVQIYNSDLSFITNFSKKVTYFIFRCLFRRKYRRKIVSLLDLLSAIYPKLPESVQINISNDAAILYNTQILPFTAVSALRPSVKCDSNVFSEFRRKDEREPFSKYILYNNNIFSPQSASFINADIQININISKKYNIGNHFRQTIYTSQKSRNLSVKKVVRNGSRSPRTIIGQETPKKPITPLINSRQHRLKTAINSRRHQYR